MADVTVIRCPASLRAAALRGLHAAASADQSEVLASAIAAEGDEESPWDGLLVVAGHEPVASVWVQRTPGRTALIRPPPPQSPWADRLLRAAAEFSDRHRIALAQLNVAATDWFSTEAMGAAGFAHLADLLYLYAEVSPVSAESPGGRELEFVPRGGDDTERLASILTRTYEGTLDCPALDGVRPVDEVLAGYREQGEYLTDQWYVVRRKSADVGVLILSSHSSVGNWELVYMGLAPEARGSALGLSIVRFALAAAARGGAQRMVLAVDAANEPAVGMYRRAGFTEWDRRTVYARLASRRHDAP